MIHEFAAWSALAGHDDPRVQVQATERFLLAIRADLGGKAPEPGELMRIFLNDYDEVMGSASIEPFRSAIRGASNPTADETPPKSL